MTDPAKPDVPQIVVLASNKLYYFQTVLAGTMMLLSLAIMYKGIYSNIHNEVPMYPQSSDIFEPTIDDPVVDAKKSKKPEKSDVQHGITVVKIPKQEPLHPPIPEEMMTRHEVDLLMQRQDNRYKERLEQQTKEIKSLLQQMDKINHKLWVTTLMANENANLLSADEKLKGKLIILNQDWKLNHLPKTMTLTPDQKEMLIDQPPPQNYVEDKR